MSKFSRADERRLGKWNVGFIEHQCTVEAKSTSKG
jgi:hypothetical protein